jgi:flagellar protein FliO/FliZ
MIEITLRIVFSLLIVLALMWAVAKVLRKPMTGRAAGTMSVLARQQLSRNAAIAVVKVTDRAFVLGVTDQQVTLLAEADLAALEAPPAAAARREPLRLDHLGAGPVAASGAAQPARLSLAARLPLPAQLSMPAQPPAAVPAAPALAPAGGGAGRFTGSALSPQTWAQTVNFLRERTVRRP